MSSETKEVTTTGPSMSERFMTKVVEEFGTGVGDVALSKYQKRLAQNYFMSLDMILKAAEEKRLKKSEKYRDALPLTWGNVNLPSLARSVVSCARIGWDPLEKNHVHPIPFKNNTTNLYDITFIPGYNGLELKAKKYGLNVPDNVVIEIVFSNDVLKIFKKDRNNSSDSYEFIIDNPFDRGEIVGGFYCHEFTEQPEKNRLVPMSLRDIEKRKPAYASAEFWGGEKDKWENGKKVGKENVDGWHEQMVYKTIKRAAYSSITIDSQKIDDAYQHLLMIESSSSGAVSEERYHEEANREYIDITHDETKTITNTNTGEMTSLPAEEEEMSAEEISKIMDEEMKMSAGPDFGIE